MCLKLESFVFFSPEIHGQISAIFYYIVFVFVKVAEDRDKKKSQAFPESNVT